MLVGDELKDFFRWRYPSFLF